MTQAITVDRNEELAKTHGLNAALIRDTEAVEQIIERCKPEAIAHLPAMTQTVVLANGMRELRNAMTEKLVVHVFMPLQGTKLGFRTDKDKDGGYPWEIVRDAAIEAMLRGLRPMGNEFNIIGGNCYTTLEGLDRKLAEFPGLTDLEYTPGVPVMKDGGALVPFEATWKLHGKPDCLACIQSTSADGVVSDRRIPVRVNAGQIVDAILGKAKRKMMARIFERISGIKTPDGDVEPIDTVGEAVAADTRAQGTDAASNDLVEKHKAKIAERKNGQKNERQPGEEG